ncbi:MAG: nitroreductase/quinone reductase family protein [Acidimicrobiales bacterium]
MHRLDDLRRSATQRGFRALNKVVVPAVKAGLGSPLPAGLGIVVLETTGRVSGEPRQVPLLATRLGRWVNVSTVRRPSQWVKNLEAQPEVSVWVGGRKRDATGTADTGLLTTANLRLS